MAQVFQMADGRFYNPSSGQSGASHASVGGQPGGSYLTGTVGEATRVNVPRVNVPGATPPQTPQHQQMTLAQAQAQAAGAFSGMQSPMTMDQIRERELEAQELGRETAASIYTPQIKGSEALGRGQMSTVRGAVGQGSGFALSTAEMTFMNNTQAEVQSRTKEIVDTKANYIAQGDFQAAERADQQIASLREYENQLVMAKANYALQLMSGDREQANVVLNQQKFAFDQYSTERQLDTQEIGMLLSLPKGESFTYNGKTYEGLGKPADADPFWKSSDIISLMKALPAGMNETIVDPNTGREYSITGLGSDPNVKVVTSEDSGGNLTITKYDVSTGKIVSQTSAGRVGRSGGTGTTVNLKMDAVGARSPIYNEYTKQQIGFQSFNEQTGKAQFFDLTGNTMSAPSTPFYVGTLGQAGQQPEELVEDQINNLFD
jgi:hypothetical protein